MLHRWRPRGHCPYSEGGPGGPCNGSPVTGPGLPPGALGPPRALTSAKGLRHEEARTAWLAQLSPQTADRAAAVHRPGQESAQHRSHRGQAGFATGTARPGLRTPGKDQRPRSSCPRSVSLQWRLLAGSPLQSTPCLQAVTPLCGKGVDTFVCLYGTVRRSKPVYILSLD